MQNQDTTLKLLLNMQETIESPEKLSKRKINSDLIKTVIMVYEKQGSLEKKAGEIEERLENKERKQTNIMLVLAVVVGLFGYIVGVNLPFLSLLIIP
jgi:hypothetical protein